MVDDSIRDEPAQQTAMTVPTNGMSAPAATPMPSASPRVRIDGDVEFTMVSIGDVDIVRCVHHGTGQHFQFGTAEHHIAMLVDGKNSINDIVRIAADDGLDWSPEDVAEFVALLVAQKIAVVVEPTELTASHSTGGPSAGASVPAAKPMSQASLLAGLIKTCGLVVSLRFPLVSGNRLAEWGLPLVRPLLSTPGLPIAIGVITLSMIAGGLNARLLAGELSRVFDSHLWIVMIGVWALLKLVHELGHACFAKLHDVRVGRAGIMFFVFAPLAYVDVTDAWKLPRRRDRIAIALGGVYFEMICGAIAFWVWYAFQGQLVGHVAAQVFFIAGPATLLVNANPLLRLDGYYVVSDLVDIPNLREHGRRIIADAIKSHLFGIATQPSLLASRRKVFAAMHAMASILFQVVWMTGLVIVVSMWAGPIGLLVAGCAIALWFLLPTGKALLDIWNYQSADPEFSVGSHRRRFLWTCLTLMALGQMVLSLPSPISRKIPLVARFANEEVVRAPVSGFIQQVYFQTGQRVRRGEVLLAMRDDELTARRDDLRLKVETQTIEWQRYQQQGQLGLADAAKKRGESYRRELAEVEAQVDSLQVTATVDGEILTPDLTRLQGCYVHEGVELFRIGRRQHKELLLSVGEDDLGDYTESVIHSRPLKVHFRDGNSARIVPTPIRPRGTRQIPHPALPATAGGPLPVGPPLDATQGVQAEFLDPRFQAIAEVPTGFADRIQAGQVGFLALRDRRSLGRRLYEWIQVEQR